MNNKQKAPNAMSELRAMTPMSAERRTSPTKIRKSSPQKRKLTHKESFRKAVLALLDFLEKHGKKCAVAVLSAVAATVLITVFSGIGKAEDKKSEDTYVPLRSDIILGQTETKAAKSTPAASFSAPELPEKYTVTLSFYGKDDLTVTTEERTVGELISVIGLELTDTEKENIDLNGMISGDMEISVDSLKTETVSEEYQIDYEIQYVDDDNLDYGTTSVVQEGKEGVGVKEYSVTTLNGDVLERTETADYVKEYPVNRIIHRGSRGTVNIGGELYTYSRYIPSCFTTVYTVWHGQGWTACGLPADESVIAVDPSVIPYHTKVYIEGIGIRIAADCGTAIKGDMIDIYFNSDNPLFSNYGVQYRNVYILK